MSCEDIPSLLDLQNTKKHADDFGRLMGTGEGDSTNSVTGQVRPTYNKVMKSVGFKPGSGDFTTGFTVMPGQRDYAWYDSVSHNWYSYLGTIPASGYFVVPETDPSSDINWKPVTDQVLREQLASNVGTSMIGASKWRTLQQKNNDSVNPMDHGAIADGLLHPLSERYATLADALVDYPHATSLTDSIDWAALQSCFNSNATVFDIVGSVNYIVNKNLTRTTSTHLRGDGIAHIHLVNAAIITVIGEVVRIPNLSADITKTNNIISFSGPHGLMETDVIIAYNPADFSWSGHRSYYHEGEYFKLYSVTSTTAKMYGFPADNYAAPLMEMYRLNGPSVVIDNVPITALSSPSDSASCIVLTFCKHVHITNARSAGGHSASIRVDRCYDVIVDGGSTHNNSAVVTDEYGVSIWNSQKVFIKSGDHGATRHAVELGGTGFVCSVPTRDVFVDGCFLANDTSNDNGGSADMHGIIDRVKYSNCTVYYGGLGGRNVGYYNCTIYSRESTIDGVCLYGSEVVGGSYDVIDCTLITNGDLATWGAISLAPSSPLRENLTLKVRNLTVKGGGGGPAALMVRINTLAGEAKKLDVDIRGVRCELSQARAVLYIRGGSDGNAAAPSNGHIVDDIYGPSGMYTIYPSGAALAGIPTREMEQRGSVVVTTIASDVVPAGPVSFRYPYSKMPAAITSVSSPSGSSQSKINGVTPISLLFALTNTTIRPAISSINPSTDFVAGTDVRLHWQAGILDI